MGFNGIKFFELVRVITNNHNWGADLANFFDTLGCSWTFFVFCCPIYTVSIFNQNLAYTKLKNNTFLNNKCFMRRTVHDMWMIWVDGICRKDRSFDRSQLKGSFKEKTPSECQAQLDNE